MIESMGHFTAIGMRTPVTEPNALVINTCGRNDTAEKGDYTNWVWSNPTNRRFPAQYLDIEAVSTECLWQGTKLTPEYPSPRTEILQGNWRLNKGKRPNGAYNGHTAPAITNPGDARRKIYIPAFGNQIWRWIWNDEDVRDWVLKARKHDGPVYLRDFDTGRGIDRRGPLSHAWILATWLNTNEWPD